MPGRDGNDLRKIDFRCALDGGEGRELENEINKAEQREGEPDSFVACDAAETVAQRQSDRIGKHHQQVTDQEPDERIDARQAGHDALPNQAPMPIKRPVNHEPASDDIFLRHRSPVATVVTRVTIVAQREITVRRYSKGLIA